MQHFISSSLEDVLQLGSADAGSTQPAAACEAVQHVFGASLAHVPAYRGFVQEQQEQGQGNLPGHSCNPMSQIPYTTKANYFHAYPLAQRCFGGQLAGADFVHFSSGSSGKPTPWARCADDEAEVAARFEQVLRDSFSCHERSSLCVVALPLGSWVGGVFTTMCLRLLSLKGYRLVLTTPGNKPPEILQVIEDLGPSCDQTIILGYPPFVKTVIDEGLARGMQWGQHSLKLVLAGEVFSEEWRTLVSARGDIEEPHRSVASIYGTADAGVIAQETPLSATIRRWLSEHPEAARQLLGRDRLPTLAQYDPHCRLLELHPEDGTIVVTSLPGPGRAQQLHEAAGKGGGCALRGAPLLRYCIGDAGGLASFNEMMGFLRSKGYDPLADDRCGPVRRQPFAWVFGRSFWAVSLYGANVFVEQVMPALEGRASGEDEEGRPSPALALASAAATDDGRAAEGLAKLEDLLTGKFVLYVEDDEDLNKRLALRVELARSAAAGRGGGGRRDGGDSAALAGRVAHAVRRELLRVSSEYAAYVPEDRQLPAVKLHEHGDPEWFPVGVKHRYTLA